MSDTERQVEREATHTNYNTGEPCFCDAPFDYLPGPCLDQPEPATWEWLKMTAELWLYVEDEDGFQRGKRLDPEQVVFPPIDFVAGRGVIPGITVADIIDALDQEEE